jgi:ABC-2 type transport system permease protein
MARALHAEWTKLRTSPGTGWLLLGIVAATLLVSWVSLASCAHGQCTVDTPRLSLTGLQLGQAVVAVLAVLVVGTEYSTGLIGITLAALPRRGTVLVAKAMVVTGPVLVAATVAVGGSLLLGRAMLDGFPAWSAAQARAAGGSVLYLALVGLLGVGLAAALRNSAAAIGAVLGLLYLFPIVAAAASDPHWQRHLQQVGPTSAGLAVQATVGLDDLPIGPWRGLGVLAAWAAGALLLGAAVLRFRDAGAAAR